MNTEIDDAAEEAIVSALADFSPHRPKEEKKPMDISRPKIMNPFAGTSEPEPVGKRLAPVVDKAQAVLTEAQALCQHVTGVQALDQDPGKDDGSRGLAGQIDWQASLIEKKLDAVLQAIDTVRRKL
ncbi:hypothetical protein GOD36_23660 [Sinorhizobium medicae]|nr:hypothetical protein [Sinorhizobium medicae]MDX0826635.1 hypothetical protein [Sinorhizobium medicae]